MGARSTLEAIADAVRPAGTPGLRHVIERAEREVLVVREDHDEVGLRSSSRHRRRGRAAGEEAEEEQGSEQAVEESHRVFLDSSTPYIASLE